MRGIFLVMGFVCFFVALCFGFVDQGFAQQNFQSTGNDEEFTREDNINLKKAIEDEEWDLAVSYLEKKQIFLKRLIEKAEGLIGIIDNEISAQGGDPESDPEMIELRSMLSSSKNILGNLNSQLREMRELSRIMKNPSTIM